VMKASRASTGSPATDQLRASGGPGCASTGMPVSDPSPVPSGPLTVMRNVHDPGVDLAEFGWERQERDEPFPRAGPGRDRRRIPTAQCGCGEREQFGLGDLGCRRRVDRLERCDLLAVHAADAPRVTRCCGVYDLRPHRSHDCRVELELLQDQAGSVGSLLGGLGGQ
jgi:hypothetical protein